MCKKFVRINSNTRVSKNPNKVRTFKRDFDETEWYNTKCACSEQPCPPPGNSTISNICTIENELRRLQQKAVESRFQRKFKTSCICNDDFLKCIIPQRTPHELQTHSIYREEYLNAKHNLNRPIHDATQFSREPCPSVVRLNSPMQVRDVERRDEAAEKEEVNKDSKKKVKLRYASPCCSTDVIFAPPKKVVGHEKSELLVQKRPKSGMFHNAVEPPCIPADGIQYSSYNPRLLQQKLDDQGLRGIDIINGKSPQDMWTWNLAVQRRNNEYD